MRVNVYAEEMTDIVELVSKKIDGRVYTGIRFYLQLPATDMDGKQHQGPFMHREGDDDSAAVTFWGKAKLRHALQTALALLGPDPARCIERTDEDVTPETSAAPGGAERQQT